MDDLRNSINSSSEIQDLRSQLIQAQGKMSKMYSEEEVRNIANWTFEFYRRHDLSDDELFNKILVEKLQINKL